MSNSALTNVNIKRLSTLIQNNLCPILEHNLFCVNNEYTRTRIKVTAEALMMSLKRQGVIDDFSVVCDSPNSIPTSCLTMNVGVKTLYGNFAQHIYIDDPLLKTIYRENVVTFRIPEELISEIKQQIDDHGLKYDVKYSEENNNLSEYILTFADDTNSAQFILYIAPDYKVEDLNG